MHAGSHFGIPGSGSAAIFLGGMLLIGFTPGPRMLSDNLDITYTIIWSVALANIFGAGLCFMLAGKMAKLSAIPFVYLAPFVLTVIFFGAFNSTRHWGDLLALFALGGLGIFMRRFGFSRPAFLIGFVLQNIIESLLYRILQVYSFENFFSRPGNLVLGAIVIAALIYGLRMKTKVQTETTAHELSAKHRGPQIGFILFIMALVAYSIYDVWDLVFLGHVLPIATSLFVLFLCSIGLFILIRGNPGSSFYHDGELEWQQSAEGYEKGPFHYVWWVVGFLVSTYLIGFLLSIVAFYFVFMRTKAKTSWLGIALMSGASVGALAAISWVFVVDFPKGILQQLVAMPWPFN